MKISKNSLGFIISYDFLPPSLCNDLIKVLADSGSFTHVFVPELWGYDAFTQITGMIPHAPNLTFGTGIVNLYSRTPATLAQTAAALDTLTEGKFILGLGLSGPIVIQDWHGVSYFKHSPLGRTREYIEILRLIFSGEPVNYNGQIFKLKRFKIRTFATPLDIPLWVAALGPKNLALVGELADGWFPIWAPIGGFKFLTEDLAKGYANRSPDLGKQVEIAPFLITCAYEGDRAKLLVQKNIAYYVGGMGEFYYNFAKRMGFTSEAEKIRSAWKMGEREAAAKAVSQEMLDKIAALGSAEKIQQRYQEFRAEGVTLPICTLPYNCPPDLALETIRAFSG
ncbi:MAG: LLM class flavin-dependent oxidoreductase [Candidatus Thorarchaeota archaeon]